MPTSRQQGNERTPPIIVLATIVLPTVATIVAFVLALTAVSNTLLPILTPLLGSQLTSASSTLNLVALLLVPIGLLGAAALAWMVLPSSSSRRSRSGR